MAEILRYGAYLPRYRAPLGEIQSFYGKPGRPRAKTLATPALDEDPLTMAYEAGSPADHDHEVQDARWFPIEQIEQLTFPSERAVVDQAKRILSDQSLARFVDPDLRGLALLPLAPGGAVAALGWWLARNGRKRLPRSI